MELSERKKKILKSVVEAYIDSGEPVGSKYLITSEHYDVSSATIRNEMSDLEDLGYLEQPHTSAGRVPTALGYRTYIDSLMEDYFLSMDEIKLLNGLLTYKVRELGSVMEHASRVMSELTNYTSFAVLRSPEMLPKRFETVRIDPNSIMLIVICGDDLIKTTHLKLRNPLPDEALPIIQNALNQVLTGVSYDKINMPVMVSFEEAMGEYRSYASVVLRAIYDLLSTEDKEKVYLEGATKLLAYPEFSNASKAKSVLELFETEKPLSEILQNAPEDQVSVLIDDENQKLPVSDSSFVVQPIKIDGHTVGAIGVVGPKRMDYKKVFAGLNYLVAGLNKEAQNEALSPDNINNTERLDGRHDEKE